MLTVMAFAVATIFSSEVTTSMGQEVLLRGFNCGSLNYLNDDGARDEFESTIQPYFSQRTALSMAYAQRCYVSNANSRDCSVFYQPRLHWMAVRNATCPFPGGEDICLSNSSNLRLDSGYIDSDHDLGINSPPGTRFLYRSVAECAPLKTKGYARNATYVPQLARDNVNQTVVQYFYDESPDDNITYQYTLDSVIGPNYHDGIEKSAFSDYSLE